MTRTGTGATARRKPSPTDGTTLIEVLLAIALIAIALCAIYGAISIGTRLVYASSQRVTAFSLCKQRLEQMRASDYARITPTNYPPETVTLTHLGGEDRMPLTGTRTSLIEDKENVTRKEVSVTVTWDFQDRTLSETVNGTIYEKP